MRQLYRYAIHNVPTKKKGLGMKKWVWLIYLVILLGCSPNTFNQHEQKNEVPVSQISALTLNPVTESTSGPTTPPPVITPTSGPTTPPDPSTSPTKDPKEDALLLLSEFSTFKLADADWSTWKQEDPCGPVFEQKQGICGDRALAFICRYMQWGWKCRYVAIWGISGFGVNCYASHANVEVWYDNKMHWMDPTYGVYFYLDEDPDNILSMYEILKNKDSPHLKGVGWKPEYIISDLGYIKSHNAITYGNKEYKEITTFMRRQ